MNRTVLGLISDTHIPQSFHRLPPAVLAALRGVDLIIHAGDVGSLAALDELEAAAPVAAVRGNEDLDLPADPRLHGLSWLMDLNGLSVGCVHVLDFESFGTEAAVRRVFPSPPDVVIFGDTHVPEAFFLDNCLLVNPGSPTYPFNLEAQLGTVARLTVRDGRIEGCELHVLGDGRELRARLARTRLEGPVKTIFR